MNKRPFNVNDFMQFNFVYDPQIAPNSKKILYVKSSMEEKKYLSNICLYDIASNNNCQFTYGNSDSNPRWSPNGDKIAFNSSRKDRKKIYVMTANGGEAEPVVDFRYGVGEPVWSPCGTKIAFLAEMYEKQTVDDLLKCAEDENDKKIKDQNEISQRVTKLLYKYNGLPQAGLIDNKVQHIFILDLKTNKIEQLTSGSYCINEFTWSPNSQHIAFSCNMAEDIGYNIMDSDLYIIDLKSKEQKRLTKGKGLVASPTFSADGKKIAFYGHELQHLTATNISIYIVDINSLNKTDILADFDYNVGSMHIADMTLKTSIPAPIYSKCGTYIYFTYSKHGNTQLAKCNIKSAEITTITKQNIQINGYSINAEHNKAVIQFANSTTTGDIAILDLQNNKFEQITMVNKDLLNECYVAEPEEMWFKGKDNWDIQGWLLKPYNFNESEKYPLVLEVHGGPHVMYAPLFFFEFQLLASAGYCVLFTNPRGSNGYGQEFTCANFNDFGGGDYGDLMKVIDEVEKLSYVDNKRLGVTGGSFGGFMTAWIIGHSNRFKAAVAQRGVYNWLSFSGMSDCGCYFSEAEFGYLPWHNFDKLWDMSPLKYVENIKTPLLLIHAESDIRSCMEQADQLYTFLKRLNQKVELLRFPNENHDLSRSGQPKRRVERLQAIVDWFNKYL